MKTLTIITTIITTIILASICTSPVQTGEGTYLQVEQVEIPDPSPPEENPEQFHDLFNLDPGHWVRLSSYGGIADTVGTDLPRDYDGDGIDNTNETAGNAWLADYPKIKAHVAPPVTMKIEIFFNESHTAETLSSEISASDTQSTKDFSTEAVHRNETNLRTVQFQDAYNTSASGSSASESAYSQSNETSYSRGRSRSQSIEVGASATIAGYGGGGSFGRSTSSSNSSSNSSSSSISESSKISSSFEKAYGETKTKWKDVPFKNDTNSNGWTQKSGAASKHASRMRKEIREKATVSKEIKPNAGYIRAAIYISNDTINMPVKLSNILCSFMLESPGGQLLPVQSFRLRNNDYSIFEIELYGNTTFGPYVVELKGLNTLEIQEAIEKGMNPRIFIIDYKMRHVDDSNYRDVLSENFTEENLKIIEENAKGRTAGIKIVAPGIREFYRVTAFDSKCCDGASCIAGSEIESRSGINCNDPEVTPGVPLEKALTRISFSNLSIEFADLIIDMSGMEPEMDFGIEYTDDTVLPGPLFHVRTIKSINGIEMNLPEFDDSITGVTDGQVTGTTVDQEGVSFGGDDTTAYVMKPVKDFTDKDMENLRIWGVFDDGKYYYHSADLMHDDGDGDRTNDKAEFFEYNYNGQKYRVPKVMGIRSIAWPGDHYDIVLLDLSEFFDIAEDFGYNPLESGETIPFNTRWRIDSLGDNYFYPDTNSVFLGEATIGDVIEFKIMLNNTRYLDPDFGTPAIASGIRTYSNFSYGMTLDYINAEQLPEVPDKFDIEEALDFEISFGLGGDMTHWMNLVPSRSIFSIYTLDFFSDNYSSSDYGWDNTYVDGFYKPEYSWNFIDQEFTVKLRVPFEMANDYGVGPDGIVKVYMRSAPNIAYRESIWPLPYNMVKKFRGFIKDVDSNSRDIIAENTIGTPAIGDTLYVSSLDNPLTIESVYYNNTEDTYNIIISGTDPISEDVSKDDEIYINLATPLSSSNVQFRIEDDFETSWNNDHSELPASKNEPGYAPLMIDNNDYNSPIHYLGFNTDHVICNWIGNNNFSNPYWNNWSDGSDFWDFLNNTLDPFLTNSADEDLDIVVSGSQGLHNFFVAPLIERNFEVQVRIVE